MKKFLRSLLLAATFAAFANKSFADTQTWNPGGAGGGTGTWSSNNWDSASAWVAGNTASFGGTAGTVTVGTQSVGGVTFGLTGYTLSGGTINIPNTGFIFTTNGGTDTVSSGLVGASSPQVTKTGAGTLILGTLTATAGTPLLTITGGTFNSATGAFNSVVQLNAGNALGTAPAAATKEFVLSAGTLRFAQNGGNLLAITRAVQVNAAGGAIIDGGSTGTSSTFNSPITFNAGTASTNLYLANSVAGATTTFTSTGIISGTGNVVWNGSGTGLFQAVNTYSGSTTISKGTLQLNGGSLGTNSLTMAAGTTLALNGAKFRFDLSNSADRLAITTGTVTTAGTNLVRLATGSTLSPGTYPLITTATGTGSLSGTFSVDGANTLTIPAPSLIKQVGGTYYRLSLQNSNAAESVVVAAAPANIINEMPLGSSITEGVSSEGATYAGGGYRSQLYQSLVNDGRFTPHFVGSNTVLDNNAAAGYNVLSGANELHHEGHGGYTTTGILTNLNAGNFWLAPGNGVNPDYVTLSIGGNDYGSSASDTLGPVKRTDAIVSSIVALRPAAHIILSNLFYRTQTSSGQVVGDLQNTYYNPNVPVVVYNHVLAGQHVSFIDAYTPVTPNNNVSLISSDGIHPLTSGYNVFALTWYKSLATGAAYWTGGQDGSWSTVTAGNATNFAQNYNLTTPRTTALDASVDVYFNSNTAALATTLGQDIAVRGVNFAAGATGPVTVGGSSLLTLNAGGITVQNGTGAHTISAKVALGTDQTWGNVSSQTFTVSGAISGTRALAITGSYSVETQVSATGNATATQTYTGTGPIVLSGANTYSGGTSVSSGTLVVSNTAGSGTGTGGVSVGVGGNLTNNGAVSGDVSLNGTANGNGAFGGKVTVNGGATFGASGTIGGQLSVGSGGLVMLSGGALAANGGVVNNGTVRLERGAALTVGAGQTFTNNGTLDIITGTFNAPAGFTNNGIVIDSSTVKTRDVAFAGGTLNVTIDSYTDHTYQLQRSASLADGVFTNIGSLQNGTTGTVLTFTDGSPSSTQGFYRVQVDP